MANGVPETGLKLNEFQEFVASTRNRSLGTDWQLDYSRFILEEEIEFLTQHGFGSGMLMPTSNRDNYVNAPDELRYGMADELGDLIWFNVDTTDRLNLSIGSICLTAIQPLVDTEVSKPITFIDAGNIANSFAEKIKVPNKVGLMYPDEPSGYFSLVEFPGYVFTRSGHRLRRSLDKGINDLAFGPPVATELEEILPVDESLGFNLLVLAYIARARLAIDIDDIAKFTVAKLKHREIYGKENDIQFNETFVTTLTNI